MMGDVGPVVSLRSTTGYSLASLRDDGRFFEVCPSRGVVAGAIPFEEPWVRRVACGVWRVACARMAV